MAKKKKQENKSYFEEVQTGGRPKKILTEYGCETVEKLASMMCTDEEIAAFMNVSVDTLTRDHNKDAFAEHKNKGMNIGKASLRRTQFNMAQNGNSTMAIWLGKQYLNQRDRQETTITDSNVTFELAPASAMKGTK